MNTAEQEVTCLELSQELKEARFKQEGLLWWVKTSQKKTKLHCGLRGVNPIYTICVAPTVAELGKMLPEGIKITKCKRNKLWLCSFEIEKDMFHSFQEKEMCNAMAKMWLYLKKEGLL